MNYWAGQAEGTDNPFAGGFYNVMGGLASLWTPCTSDATMGVLSIAIGANAWGRSPQYWQYYPKGDVGYKSPWLTKGTKFRPPYLTGKSAREALNLPPWNEGTAVRPVNVDPSKPIVGPRNPLPKKTGVIQTQEMVKSILAEINSLNSDKFFREFDMLNQKIFIKIYSINMNIYVLKFKIYLLLVLKLYIFPRGTL